MDKQLAYEIERLIVFSEENHILHPEDENFVRNQLLELFGLYEPYGGDRIIENPQRVNEVLDKLIDYGYEIGLIKENSINRRDYLGAKIMGIVIPRPSQVVENFSKTIVDKGIEAATDEIYRLSINSNYIQMDRINKNISWRGLTDFGELEITINLSKPEKNPKEIAAAKNAPKVSYPKCLLCKENVGYSGNENHPARQNLRVIPVELLDEKWHFQYSPYVYYNEHCIVFRNEHVPMKISGRTFERLVDFLDKFPHYFIGTNADLPIVGGSILSHDHFQGGRHTFPIEKAPVENYYHNEDFKNVKIGMVKWPLSVIRLRSKDKNEIIGLSKHIFESWKNYSDEAFNIYAHTRENGEMVPHNTVTPIARKRTGEYEVDIVLRNNLTSVKYPYGIYHPHEELHHIKKENIGLIEVMGLAVLPGRLEKEVKEIKDVILNNREISEKIEKHGEWIKEIRDKYFDLYEGNINEVLRKEITDKFTEVLKHCGVYKVDENGRSGFNKFINHIGCIKLV